VPNEWFFDSSTAGGPTLYLIPNATEGPPAEDVELVAVQLETLISIKGSKANPVTDVSISGITFRDAADITMKPWGVPSGGDCECLLIYSASVVGSVSGTGLRSKSCIATC
jgi:hypothetical protein